MPLWIEIIGYIASVLVAITFYMKTIIPLRIFAICSNVFFIVYALFGNIMPVFILHCFLFPLNIIRVFQMKRLIDKVKEASQADCSMDCLVPSMTKKKYSKGDELFAKGSRVDKMYYITKGQVKLIEIDKTAGQGEIIGEIGIFSPFKQRTATAVCEEDSEIYSIDEKKITQLYFQNPSFGYFLIQLIIKRFVTTYIKKETSREGEGTGADEQAL